MSNENRFWLIVVVIIALMSLVFAGLMAYVGLQENQMHSQDVLACSRSIDPAGCLRSLNAP